MDKQVITPIARSLAKQAGGGLQATSSFNDLISAWKDYKKTCEIEATKRTQITADRDVRLAAIQEQSAIFQDLIHRSFAERASNFEQFFTLLDQGFKNDNDRQINAALAMIIEQVKVNPMAQAVQLMQQINDPDIKHLEI